ncbi:MAG: alpha/beta hydrolase [Xanthomonadales bacterium]|nr:alpha/beta hydrolase [Xanthomonadales bacterium]
MRRVALLFMALVPLVSQAAGRVEENVVFGMYSGLALLLDVHYPEKPNGFGIISIAGSGFHASLSEDDIPLKTWGAEEARPLLQAGYTIFAINHRAAPRFRYPAAVEDVQRAMRFVRFNAERFHINADRIGAFGSSSGGHLALMLGVLDGTDDADYPTPINKTSAKAQAVVVYMPSTDLVAFANNSEGAIDLLASFMGSPISLDYDPSEKPYPMQVLYEQASPITYVSADDPPILLVHGDADKVVPYTQSVVFVEKLKEAGGVVELITMPGGGHGLEILAVGENPPDYTKATIEWFDRYLVQLDRATAK